MIGIDPKEFRQVLGHYATGVAIVTAADTAGGHVGITVNSFTSVSLAPELVLFSLAQTLRSLPAFLDAKHYGINILRMEFSVHTDDCGTPERARGRVRRSCCDRSASPVVG